MPDLLAIVSKAVFERDATIDGQPIVPGDVWLIDRYASVHKALQSLERGGRIFLVTVRPPDERLWLVGVIERPASDGSAWIAPTPNQIPVTDITELRTAIAFASGKGMPGEPGSLAMSLQTPRRLTERDVELVLAAANKQPPRANRDAEPRRTVTIEPARSDRSSCNTCRRPIAQGELRLAERTRTVLGKLADERDGTFNHLDCATQDRRRAYVLRWALAATTLEIADRARLEAAIETAIETALSAVDVAEQHPEYHEFVARLGEGPDDDLLLVFGDWLQSVGDPRGELVAVQHAIETATGDERIRLGDIEKRLLAVHRKQLVPERLEGTCTWRRGFVHRLAVKHLDSESLARAFDHPSLRLLRELAVVKPSVVVAANLPTDLPSTLRVLELDGSLAGIGRIAGLLRAVPQLERLQLTGPGELDDIRHPRLAELELVSSDATRSEVAKPGTLTDRLAGLDRSGLPRLARLTLRIDRGLDAVIDALAETRALTGLHALKLIGDLSRAGIERLTTLGDARFEVLDLSDTQFVASDVIRLQRVARSVLIKQPAAPPPRPATRIGDWLVRHTRRPEWGIGRVVEETDDGYQVEFEHAGAKQVRNIELLEEIEPGG